MKKITVFIILICMCIVVFFYFQSNEKNSQELFSKESIKKIDIEKHSQAKESTTNTQIFQSQNKESSIITDEKIASFGLNHALAYFESQENFDHNGVEVDRIIHVNVDEACGGPDKIVLFKKNDIYAGVAKVNVEYGKMRIGQLGPGNYSDRNYTATYIEKPYITLEEARENVSILNPDLKFLDFTNPCVSERTLGYSHLPFFRFTDENGRKFLYNIDGVPNKLFSEELAMENLRIQLEGLDSPNAHKVNYSKEEIEDFFRSNIPETRLKVIASYDTNKIYQLVYDIDPEVQRAAFLEILDYSSPSGNTYLEDYYTDMLSANLNYEALLELQGFDFNQFNNISKNDFIEYLKESSSFVNLSEKQKNEILNKL